MHADVDPTPEQQDRGEEEEPRGGDRAGRDAQGHGIEACKGPGDQPAPRVLLLPPRFTHRGTLRASARHGVPRRIPARR